MGITGVERGLLRIVTIEQVVRQPQMRQRCRLPLAGPDRWQQTGVRFAPPGDHELLAGPSSRQKLGQVGTGFRDLVCGRRQGRIQTPGGLQSTTRSPAASEKGCTRKLVKGKRERDPCAVAII